MKILEIYIKGIHSLKEENRIDFTSGILKDAGLYAITGQTGAGKSTILDAITLSLYGETNRHGRGAAEEIITRNAREAVAETLFRVNHIVYKARWAVSKNRNNKLNDWEQKLFEQLPDGSFKLLADKKKVAQELIVKTVGLTYEQFTKSVLLAQNNFAAFLKATPNERAEMLSRITGTSIYERISIWVFEQAKWQAETLQQLKNQVKNDLLTPEEIAQLHSEIAELEQQIQLLKKQIQTLQQQEKWVKDWDEVENNIDQNQVELANLRQQLQAIEPDIAQLNRYKQAVQIQPSLLAFQFAEKQLQEISQKIATLTTEIAQNEQQLPELETLLESEKAQVADASLVLNQQLPLIEEAKQLNQHLQTIQQQIVEEQQQLDQLLADTQVNQAGQQTCLAQKQQTEAQITTINEQINSYQSFAEWPKYEGVLRNIYTDIEKTEKLAAQINLQIQADEIQVKEKELAEKQKLLKQKDEELASENHKLQSIMLHLQKLPSLADSYQQQSKHTQTIATLLAWKEHVEKKQAVDAEIKQTEQLIHQVEAAIANLENHIHQANERKTELTLSLDVQKAMQGLSAHRASLIQGEACPLCGALEHPFAENLPPLAINDTEVKLSAISEQLTDLNQHWQQQKEALTANKIRLQQAETKHQELTIQIQQQKETVNLPLQNDDIHAIDLLINEVQKEVHALKQTIEKIEAFAHQKELLETSSKKIDKECQELKSLVQQLSLQLLNCEKNKENDEKQLVAYQKQRVELLENANQSFSMLGNPLAELSKEAIAKQGKIMKEGYEFFVKISNNQLKLQEQIQEYENKLIQYISKANWLEQQIQSTQSSLEAKQQQEKIFKQQWTAVTHNFELAAPAEEEKRLRNQYEVAQKKVTTTQIQLQTVTTKLQQQQGQLLEAQQQKQAQDKDVAAKSSQLQTALLQQGFTNLEHLQQALAFTNAAAIEQQQQAIHQQLTQTETLLNQYLRRKEVLIQQPYERIAMEQLQQQLQSYQTDSDLVNQQLGAKNEQLKKDAEEKQANQQLVQQILQQEVVTTQWEQLSKIIGSRNGDAFKRFAQDLTLSLLVQLANQHLSVMFDRYELYKGDTSEEMELQIKDKHFFNEIRSINSLSGGETFLVSLALALGLSDLASRNIKIQSLFIDEGFGSLDPESLSSALDALELLQQHGNRQIGIISHIEELKKRVYTQVKVVKTSAEFSKIVVEG